MNVNRNFITRRKFLHSSAAAIAGFTILPSKVISGLGHTPPSDRLNIAAVGVGGIGRINLKGLSSQHIVALCDVDWSYAAQTFADFPDAMRYYDYRRMLDEMKGSIDAVVVSTPDHSHAVIAADAITLGKHVYVEKPLTHNVYESRLLSKLADKYRVATQMGNRGASDIGTNRAIEWLWNNEIGDVRRVEASTDRPLWPQGLNRPDTIDEIPGTLNWDLFIGPAVMRPFNKIYHPWNWRGWWDFGTGALGDMACHILHVAFEGLQLKHPSKIQASSTVLMADSCPKAQKVTYKFPDRGRIDRLDLPPVEITWYDGGLMPSHPKGAEGRSIENASIFYGSKDIMVCGGHGAMPWLVSGRVPDAPKKLREVQSDHYEDWVRACKESPENRVKTASDFSSAGPFNEMVVMGVLAVRLQGLEKELDWDGENMRFTNIADHETITFRKINQSGPNDDHTEQKNAYTEPVNANQFAEQLIRGSYREGWTMPEMP